VGRLGEWGGCGGGPGGAGGDAGHIDGMSQCGRKTSRGVSVVWMGHSGWFGRVFWLDTTVLAGARSGLVASWRFVRGER